MAQAFFLAAPLLARFTNAPSHVSLFRLVSAIPLLYSFYAVFVGTANGLRRFRLQASFDVGFSCFKTILLLGGAALGARLGGAVAGAFVGFITAAALILLVSIRTIRLPRADRVFPVLALAAFLTRPQAEFNSAPSAKSKRDGGGCQIQSCASQITAT